MNYEVVTLTVNCKEKKNLECGQILPSYSTDVQYIGMVPNHNYNKVISKLLFDQHRTPHAYTTTKCFDNICNQFLSIHKSYYSHRVTIRVSLTHEEVLLQLQSNQQIPHYLEVFPRASFQGGLGAGCGNPLPSAHGNASMHIRGTLSLIIKVNRMTDISQSKLLFHVDKK